MLSLFKSGAWVRRWICTLRASPTAGKYACLIFVFPFCSASSVDLILPPKSDVHVLANVSPGERENARERERENSELYYSRIKILGSCLFLQSVHVDLYASRLHIKQL